MRRILRSGNAIGSNIANIGLVIGLSAIIHPLVVQSQTLRRELPVMVAVSLIPVILFMDFDLSRFDGGLLLLAFVALMYWVIRLGSRTSGHDSLEAEYAAEIPGDVKQGMAVVLDSRRLDHPGDRLEFTGLGVARIWPCY